MKPHHSTLPTILALIALTATGLTGCRGKGRADTIGMIDSTKMLVEPDVTLYIPEYADGFRIDGWKGHQSELITVTKPWQGAKDAEYQLLLLMNDDVEPEWYKGPVMHGVASSVITMSSSHIAMLDYIGETETVTGVSGLKYIMNEDINSRKDKIAEVGPDSNVDLETFRAINPDLVLLYGVAGPSAFEKHLQFYFTPYIYIGDHAEEHPLGKAEWMAAVRDLVGGSYHSIEKFEQLANYYNGLKEQVDSIKGRRPKVMLNFPYNDVWYMPSANNYMVRLIEDAGGDYIYKNNTTGSAQPIDSEEAYKLLCEADVWINTGTATSMKELLTQRPRLADAPCVKAGRVYNNNRRLTPAGGNDFFESGVMHPDVVLEDLIEILHPQSKTDDNKLYYYRHMK